MEENSLRQFRGIFITLQEYAKFEKGHELTEKELKVISDYGNMVKSPRYIPADIYKFPQNWREGWYYVILYEKRTGRLIKALATGGVDEFDDDDKILFFCEIPADKTHLAQIAEKPIWITQGIIKVDGNAAIEPETGWRYIKYSWTFLHLDAEKDLIYGDTKIMMTEDESTIYLKREKEESPKLPKQLLNANYDKTKPINLPVDNLWYKK